MQIKESLSESKTVDQMHEILKPLEHTRVDRLIDIMFTTSEDLQVETVDAESDALGGGSENIQAPSPMKYHDAVVDKVSTHLGLPIIQQGRCKYSSGDQATRVLCIVSREYEKSNAKRYWYSFRPSQKEFLNGADTALVAFGCGSADQIALIPWPDFEKNLSDMRVTNSDGRFYWHVDIFKTDQRFQLSKPTSDGVDITHFMI